MAKLPLKNIFTVRAKTSGSKTFWSPAEAVLIGLLVLVGVDVALGLLLLTSGASDIATDTLYVNFGLFTLSRAIGIWLVIKFIKSRGISLKRFGFRPFPLFKTAGRIMAATAILILASGAIFYVTQRIIPNVNLQQEQEIVFSGAHGWGQLSLAFIALVIIAPVVEEMIFRGLMLPAFARRYGILAAAVLTSLLFGAVHWQLNIGIVTFVMGLLLAWLYYKSRSLWPAIMFHSLKNLLAFMLIFSLP